MALTRDRRGANSPSMTARPILLATALLMPFGAIQLGTTTSFMTALVSVVTCFDVLSVYLLLGRFRDKGDLRLLMMAAAYAWSLVAMAGYALAFPGAVSLHPPLETTASVAPYLYIAWHGGFPVLLGLAAAPWPSRLPQVASPERRTAVLLPTMAAAVVAAVLVVAFVVTDVAHLPVLIVGLDTTRMTTLTAPVVLPLVFGALALSHLGTRKAARGAVSWCTVTILVCACDLVLTYTARHRFSLGWYGGRMLTLVAAALVMAAMLASFRKVSAQAEHDAAHDPLTGLANRRSLHESLERMISLARRSGRPLGVVTLDLDHFKSVNDQHGHAAGDLTLTAVGEVLRRTSRAGDLVARVGGEEFLVVLADTGDAGTRSAAEALRRAMSSLVLPGLPALTASLGATTLKASDRSSDELLRRADQALYLAKERGRNRVVVAGDPVPRLTVLEGQRGAEPAAG